MGSLKPKNFPFQAFFAFIEPLMSVFAFGFSSPHRKNRYKIDFFHQFFKIRRFCIKIWRKPDLFFISPRKSIFPALKTDFFSKLWNSTPTENCCKFFFSTPKAFFFKEISKNQKILLSSKNHQKSKFSQNNQWMLKCAYFSSSFRFNRGKRAHTKKAWEITIKTLNLTT